MPRPKVRPADRQRAAKACTFCKASKKRCDANLPCLLCVQKGRAASCTYPDSSSIRRWEVGRSPRVQQSPNVRPETSSTQGSLASPRRPVEQVLQQSDFQTLGPSTRESLAETRESSPQCTQRPTMLLSSRGEHG